MASFSINTVDAFVGFCEILQCSALLDAKSVVPTTSITFVASLACAIHLQLLKPCAFIRSAEGIYHAFRIHFLTLFERRTSFATFIGKFLFVVVTANFIAFFAIQTRRESWRAGFALSIFEQFLFGVAAVGTTYQTIFT